MRADAKSGSMNETMILTSLNDHKFFELSDNWKRHIKRMFKDIKDNDKIICHYYEYKDAKPDLTIKVKNRTIMLSVKSGHNPSVHLEPIYSFYDFLRNNGVPEAIIRKIAFYHTGHFIKLDKYYTREEIVEKYPNLTQDVNNYFACHSEITREMVYRTIIRGRLKRDLIDYFYYGNSTRGYLLSVVDILKLIEADNNMYYKSICFKSLVYRPASRDKDNPRCRSVVIHWPILCKWFYDEEFIKRYG